MTSPHVTVGGDQMLRGKHLRAQSGPSPRSGAMLYSPIMASQSQQPVSLDQVKLAIASVNDLFNREGVGKRNIAALDDVYTSDARILPPGSPVISTREAIKRFWTDWIQSANPKSAVLDSVD